MEGVGSADAVGGYLFFDVGQGDGAGGFPGCGGRFDEIEIVGDEVEEAPDGGAGHGGVVWLVGGGVGVPCSGGRTARRLSRLRRGDLLWIVLCGRRCPRLRRCLLCRFPGIVVRGLVCARCTLV